MASVGSDPMPARHVFKFAVSGIELSKKHQQVVADRVAEAGIEALASLNLGSHDQLQTDIREWLGRWLHMLDVERVAQEGVQIGPEVIAGIREGSNF